MTRGVDLTADYKAGDFGLHLLANYVADASSTQPGADPVSLVGRVNYTAVTDGLSGTPRWRATVRGTWNRGPFTANVTERFVGGGRVVDYQYDYTDYNLLYAGQRFYTDLSFQYDLDAEHAGTRQVFLGIRNLFDRNPPITGGTSLGQPPTDSDLYDVIGRQFQAGVRFQF